MSIGYLYGLAEKITINASQVCGSGSHANFPVLIHVTDADLATAANKVQNANGYDILFTQVDGTTLMDHEIQLYVAATGEYIAWVSIPTLSTSVNTCIYMYYGNCDPAITDPSVTTTWNSDYQTVLHLQESGSGSTDEFLDATSNTVHGTGGGLPGAGNGGFTPAQTTGKFGFAQDFDGTNDRIRLQPINDDAWTAVTVQTWVNPDGTGDERIFGKCWGTGSTNETWLLRQPAGGFIGSRWNVNNGGADNSISLDDDDSPVAYTPGT